MSGTFGEMTTGTNSASRAHASDSIISGSEVTDQIITGTRVISGSSPEIDEEELPPSVVRLEVPHGEGLAVYMGIAWSLLFEAGVAAIGYAIFQVWKLL